MQEYKLNTIFHYPPELMNLLIDTIPLLFKGKKDVILFFYGAGVPYALIDDVNEIVERDRDSISKYEIVRRIITRINVEEDYTLGARREVLKRVTEFEDFSTCWPKDLLKAKGLVAEVMRVVNIKDSFTRMNQERESEKRKHQEEYQAKLQKEQQKRLEVSSVKGELFSLFGEKNPQKRGKRLEETLNNLFKVYGISIRESFSLVGNEGEGIVEQIDGVIELDGNLYLVEMKWWTDPIGVGEISQHLVRLFRRDQTRGIFISASGFSDPAVSTCKDALGHRVMILINLQEIIILLENNGDLRAFLDKKIRSAIINLNPYCQF